MTARENSTMHLEEVGSVVAVVILSQDLEQGEGVADGTSSPP